MNNLKIHPKLASTKYITKYLNKIDSIDITQILDHYTNLQQIRLKMI